MGCEFDDICSLISSKKIKIENKEDLHRLSEDLENIVGYIFIKNDPEKDMAVTKGYDYSEIFKATFSYGKGCDWLREWETISKVWSFLKSDIMNGIMRQLNTKDPKNWSEAFGHYNALFDLEKKGVIDCFLQAYKIADITTPKGSLNLDNCAFCYKGRHDWEKPWQNRWKELLKERWGESWNTRSDLVEHDIFS